MQEDYCENCCPGAKALKGINKKAVIKVPAKKLKVYKKLFKGKGQAKTVKIKR